ncbi:single-stranded DNA-binding protein [Brucella anthropi]|uniref:single-stranded DNA-binding protein n=1 Tax=Brucella anthropi TaxID=529 RepID=UPI00124C9D51|nr:single-stranded DNA-binding protein [Brucella anthropi]KAB2752313.1 single-stranded DNA-binding protein [Brucella anthropi]
MAGINKTILVGRVGQDPEVRRFNSGDQVAEFSLATSKEWRDKNTGERKSKTTWHKIKVLNNSLIENVIRPYVNKGSLIGIEGELDNEEWEKDGQKRQATKVVVGAFSGSLYLLGSKDDNGGDRGSRGRDDDRGSRSSGRYSNDDRGQSSGGYGGGFSRDLDDEIPFAPEWR